MGKIILRYTKITIREQFNKLLRDFKRSWVYNFWWIFYDRLRNATFYWPATKRIKCEKQAAAIRREKYHIDWGYLLNRTCYGQAIIQVKQIIIGIYFVQIIQNCCVVNIDQEDSRRLRHWHFQKHFTKLSERQSFGSKYQSIEIKNGFSSTQWWNKRL